MLLSTPLPFVENFINELDKGLKIYEPELGLSRIQRGWLGFCRMGIILTNSVCWAKFERASLGKYKVGALSWMFRICLPTLENDATSWGSNSPQAAWYP